MIKKIFKDQSKNRLLKRIEEYKRRGWIQKTEIKESQYYSKEYSWNGNFKPRYTGTEEGKQYAVQMELPAKHKK